MDTLIQEFYDEWNMELSKLRKLDIITPQQYRTARGQLRVHDFESPSAFIINKKTLKGECHV